MIPVGAEMPQPDGIVGLLADATVPTALHIEAIEVLRRIEIAVGEIVLGSNIGRLPLGLLGVTQQIECAVGPVGVELPGFELDGALIQGVLRAKIHPACCAEIAFFSQVRAFAEVHPLNEFGDDEV